MVAATNSDLPYTIQCRKCMKYVYLSIDSRGFENWKNGQLIQIAMPYLTRDEREILISRICGPCFDEIFSPEESENE